MSKSRYDTAGIQQAEFEPGSDQGVLKNSLQITDPGVMDDIELDLLVQLYEQIPIG